MKKVLILCALNGCVSTEMAFQKYVVETYGTPEHGWQRTTGVVEKNPVPSDQQSRARGETLYQQYCSACHGESGRGDGPQAGNRKPAPADLTKLMDRSDYHIFLQISLGRQGMPIWAEQISERDRWHIVNYVKALKEKS